MAVATQPRPARLGRLERPALTGVLVREVVNYSSYWKSSTFIDGRADDLSSGVRIRVRLDRQHDWRIRLRRLRRHRNGRDGGAFSSAFAAMFGTFVKYQFQHYVRRDPGGARRHRGARHRRGPVDGDARGRLRLRPDARRDRVRARTVLGHVRRALHRVDRRLRLGVLRDLGGGLPRSRSRTSTTSSAVLTPMFLLAGSFFPLDELPRWAQVLAALNPLYHCVELVRDAVFGFDGWQDSAVARVSDSLRGRGGSRSTR